MLKWLSVAVAVMSIPELFTYFPLTGVLPQPVVYITFKVGAVESMTNDAVERDAVLPAESVAVRRMTADDVFTLGTVHAYVPLLASPEDIVVKLVPPSVEYARATGLAANPTASVTLAVFHVMFVTCPPENTLAEVGAVMAPAVTLGAVSSMVNGDEVTEPLLLMTLYAVSRSW